MTVGNAVVAHKASTIQPRLSSASVCSLFHSTFHSIVSFHIPFQSLETPVPDVKFFAGTHSLSRHFGESMYKVYYSRSV